MPKAVTVKGATARVTPIGVTVTGADSDAASVRVTTLANANNGKSLRDDAERFADRGAVAANIHAMVRMTLAGTIVPTATLTEARTAMRDGKLRGVRFPIATITTGKSASAVNMKLDSEAKWAGADGFTVRAMDAGNGEIFAYIGKPK